MGLETIPSTIAARAADSSAPTVFAIIPVFNRLYFTRECIRQLKSQTYAPLHIVVVDGGSTDGTVSALRSEHRDVDVLTSTGVLWWGGAMAMGIEFALARRRTEDDCVLMMNNDTVVPVDYVEQLVRASTEHCAAVGALTVDSRDPTRIVDAGVKLDWPTYTFTSSTCVAPGEHFRDDVDVLPGRGSLVPLRMIRMAGSVDARRLPHYLCDYEFFYRIKQSGFRLGVCFDTHLCAHLEQTGVVADAKAFGLVTVLRELFARRSKSNIIDHWHFVGRHAPDALRKQTQVLLLRCVIDNIEFRTGLGRLLPPIRWLKRTVVRVYGAMRAGTVRVR
jgi:GT2 family glycosyltransferase